MRKTIIFCLIAAALASAQQKRSVAVLPSVAENKALDPQGLILLTDKVREIASKTLPMDRFILLKQDVIVSRIGEEELFRACKEGVCVAELTKSVGTDYGARCDIFKRDNNLLLKFELYSVRDEAIVETFTEYRLKDFYAMLDLLDARLPDAFRKMITTARSAPLPAVQGGIGNVETTGGGALEYGGRSYVVSVNTDPQGASLSFNGVPVGSCGKSPCKVELSEGSVRVLAAMEQYETADTTASIKQNNQSVNIKLRPNFGILEIKTAYSEGAGNNRQWSLTINGRAYSSFENRLSPGNYEVKLSHECYEDIRFKAGINKGSREVFDMAQYLKLKMGVLVLSAETDGGPVSEPVFANGKRVGETPFNRAVPVCAEIAIGNARDKVDVKIIYNQTVRHQHRISEKILASPNVTQPVLRTFGTMTDSRDGKKYRTVKIGSQTWMAENLNYDAKNSKCYGNSAGNCAKYGRLYNWKTAMNGAKSSSSNPSRVQGVCPVGWHLPSDAEWTALTDYVGGSSTAGKKLKSTSGWNNNGNGTDEHGFSALPGGSGNSGGDFYYAGYGGYWWSATEVDASYAWNRHMNCNREYVSGGSGDKAGLFSARCVADE